MTTFVSVGNATQPFSRFLDAVNAIADRLPGPVVVQFGHTPFTGRPPIEAIGFLGMEEFGRLITEASLVLTHAGAGTVISALRANKVPVVMPRSSARGEHVDDHQLEFARELEKMGRIVVAREPGDLARAIEQAIKRQASCENVAEPRLIALVEARLQAYLPK